MRSPTPCMRQVTPARQTGTSAPMRKAAAAMSAIDRRDACELQEALEGGRRIGRPAADAGGHGQVLGEVHGTRAASMRPRAAAMAVRRLPGLADDIAGGLGKCRGKGTIGGDGEVAGGREAQPVSDAGKGHDRIEVVIAVGPAAQHMKCEIDLGRGEDGERRLTPLGAQPLDWPGAFCAGVTGTSSGKPFFILSSIRFRSSGSGLLSRACCHWNLASSLRPDPPVGIAQMLGDDRVGGQKLHRALDVGHRLLIVAQLVIGPAEAVDDVAVIGLQLDGLLHHLHGFREG